MKKTDNKEMLNAIREQASAEYQEKIPMVDGREIQPRTIIEKINDYPSIKNEFLNTLINKVVKTDFFSRVYANPLKELKKGALPYGATIEELFVLSAEAKGFFAGSGFDSPNHTGLEMETGTNELLNQEKANIKKLYITLNFAHVFKTSISDSQLKHAVMSPTGLSDLVNQITSSLVNGAEQKEYKDMIELLKAAAMQKRLSADTKGVIKPVDLTTSGAGDYAATEIPLAVKDFGGSEGTPINPATDLKGGKKKQYGGVLQSIFKYNVNWTTEEVQAREGEKIAMAIRSLAGRLKFVSDKFNMAGVPTFCNPEDLVFVTTPEIASELDVTVVAHAFNVSAVDLKTRIILVDELPKVWYTGREINTYAMKDGVGYHTKLIKSETQTEVLKEINGNEQKCYGLLMDKNFIQAIDTVNEARTFENGRALMTNLFLHRQGMLTNCYFANCVALFNDAGYKEVMPRQHSTGAAGTEYPVR